MPAIKRKSGEQQQQPAAKSYRLGSLHDNARNNNHQKEEQPFMKALGTTKGDFLDNLLNGVPTTNTMQPPILKNTGGSKNMADVNKKFAGINLQAGGVSEYQQQQQQQQPMREKKPRLQAKQNSRALFGSPIVAAEIEAQKQKPAARQRRAKGTAKPQQPETGTEVRHTHSHYM